MTGRPIAIVGPSGVGKDTLIAGLMAARPDLYRARRTITRPAAESEDFQSVSETAFAHLLAADAFALSWRAHGLAYGIAWKEFAPLRAGRDVVFNGSRQALAAAQAVFPDLQVIEIAVSPDILQARLVERGRESAGDIAARIARADLPLPKGISAQRILNDKTPEAGIAALVAAVQPRN